MPRGRHLVRESLQSWGLDQVATPAETVASELVANAVTHGRGRVYVHLWALPGRVRLEVHDRGGGHPAIRSPHTDGPAIGGWGLRLVDQVADRWGTEVADQHTVVWAELAVRPGPDDGRSGARLASGVTDRR